MNCLPVLPPVLAEEDPIACIDCYNPPRLHGRGKSWKTAGQGMFELDELGDLCLILE
jgi:hypothetical protein